MGVLLGGRGASPRCAVCTGVDMSAATFAEGGSREWCKSGEFLRSGEGASVRFGA